MWEILGKIYRFFPVQIQGRYHKGLPLVCLSLKYFFSPCICMDKCFCGIGWRTN